MTNWELEHSANIFPATPTYLLEQRAQEWERLADSGEQPELAAGYLLVVDDTADDHSVIAPLPYTHYFAARTFPIAAPSNVNRTHDMTHLTLFPEIFKRSPLFADTVQAAAQHCGDNLRACRLFTTCFDDLSEEFLSIYVDWEDNKPYPTKSLARQSITSLVDLAAGRQDDIPAIWRDLGFEAAQAGWEHHLATRRRASMRKFLSQLPIDRPGTE